MTPINRKQQQRILPLTLAENLENEKNKNWFKDILYIKHKCVKRYLILFSVQKFPQYLN